MGAKWDGGSSGIGGGLLGGFRFRILFGFGRELRIFCIFSASRLNATITLPAVCWTTRTSSGSVFLVRLDLEGRGLPPEGVIVASFSLATAVSSCRTASDSDPDGSFLRFLMAVDRSSTASDEALRFLNERDPSMGSSSRIKVLKIE
jgi:hypothetical protein